MDEDVVQRLDQVIFLMSLAFRDEIESARRAVLADAVSAAVLEAAADDWIAAGELKRRVAAATGQSERTVSRRISQLAAQRWLQSTGAGANVRYRAGSLV